MIIVWFINLYNVREYYLSSIWFVNYLIFRRIVVLADCHNNRKKKKLNHYLLRFFTLLDKTLVRIKYRPTNTGLSDFNNELENVISLTSMRSSLIFVRDYNINLFKHTETGNFFLKNNTSCYEAYTLWWTRCNINW